MDERTRRKLSALGMASVASLGLVFTVIACEGPRGADGAAGAQGAAGSPGQTGAVGSTGPIGPAGPAGTGASDGGGLATGCMSPCHGFNGIVEQWKTSTHYVGSVLNSEEVPTWTGPGTCGNCHATDGLPQRLAGNVGVAADAGPPLAVKSGQLNYLNASGRPSEATYKGQSNVAAIACNTCHDTAAAQDPHVTGALYAPGSFKLRVPSGPSDQAMLEKSSAPGVVDGTPAGKRGASNTCVFCHKSRKDVTNYIVASNLLTSPNWGPHEAPHADVFTGIGGHHFAGKAYAGSTHQTLEGCASCHMRKVAENGNVPDHSMRVTVESCKAAGCHANATSFDIAGGQSSVRSALQELRVLLNAAGYLTRGTAAPYPALTAAELADGRFELDKTRPGSADGGNAALTADQAGGLYNYLVVARGSAAGVHNPIYTKELIYDSVVVFKGSGPAAIPTRP